LPDPTNPTSPVYPTKPLPSLMILLQAQLGHSMLEVLDNHLWKQRDPGFVTLISLCFFVINPASL
jgi:hypothetical protein